MESDVRDLAVNSSADFEIITGTEGQLELDVTDVGKLFLGENKTIPVPLYFWKIVIDKKAKEAIVFVSINHPDPISSSAHNSILILHK